MSIDVNALPIIRSNGDNFTKEFQAAIQLKKGVNEITYRTSVAAKKKSKKLRSTGVDIYLSNKSGAKPSELHYPGNPKMLAEWKHEYQSKYATVGEGRIYIKAIPGKMLFNVNTITVKAGKRMKFIFENPDEMTHNFVLIKPGKAEEVGALADQLAASPDGMKMQYVPKTSLIIFSTPLVNAGQKIELDFTTPQTPGTYPYLCTFPGHWRIMRGEMVVTK